MEFVVKGMRSVNGALEKPVKIRTHFRTHFLFRTPKYDIFRHKLRKQSACNINGISIFGKKCHASNPPSPTRKETSS